MQRQQKKIIEVLLLKVSLILCTKNGGRRLAKCLSYIGKLNAPDEFEILVVDNGSTDDTSFQIIQDFAKQCRFRFIILQTFTPGNSAGRNVGIKNSKGDLLIFIDDDCYAEPDLIIDWLNVFSESSIGYGSGKILKFNPQQSSLGCVDNMNEFIVFAGYFLPRGIIQGSNMAFRRVCFEKAEPFDERFGAGTPFAGEEWDVALQIALRGWVGGYYPKPTVLHDHGRFDDEARERLLYYDYGAGAVFAKKILQSHFWIIGKKFLAELLSLRHDLQRLRSFLKGFSVFLLQKHGSFR